MKKAIFLGAAVALSLSMAGAITAEAAGTCPGGSFQACVKILTGKGTPASNATKSCQRRCY